MKRYIFISKYCSKTTLQLYFLFLLQIVALFTIARFAFLFHIFPSLAEVSSFDIAKGFYIGWRFDIRIAALLSLPFALILLIPFAARRFMNLRKLIFGLYFVVFLVVWSAYAVDWFFYDYLGRRLDATLVTLLKDFGSSMLMVWQSYPVIYIVLSVLVTTFLTAYLCARLTKFTVLSRVTFVGKGIAFLLGFFLFAVAFWGQISKNWYPLRWSNACFLPNKVVMALGINPIQNFCDSWFNRYPAYDRAMVEKYYSLVSDFLGVEKVDAKKLDYRRFSQPMLQKSATPPNIVVFIMESIDWRKTSMAPGDSDLTPFMQQLSEQSLYYPNFYANARTTARAIYGTFTGIPDVNDKVTASRNPQVVDQFIIAPQLEQYDKLYLIGASATWANIRGVLAGNIPGVEILEGSYWKSPNTDVWGVSDYNLFQEANQVFAARKKPFLAVIQTATYHSPYTIEPIAGFESKKLSDTDKKLYDFENEKEYNALRLFDLALQRFFEAAKKESYFDNTIFILFGDHGVSSHTQNMTKAYETADLGPWHIPLFIYAPALIAPQTVQFPASQIDIFPTIASLVGQPCENRTLGRDLLDPRFDANRAVMIAGEAFRPLRLVQDGYAYVDNRAGFEALYKLDDINAENLALKEKERFAKMKELAHGLFHTSRYLLYNNKKDVKK